MANIQHLYRGAGDPHDNPDLELTGDAIGNHLYQDSNDSQSIWMSTTYEEEGHVYHDGWVRMLTEADLALLPIESNQPRFEGQMGYSADHGTLFIAMYDQSPPDYPLRWRSTGTVLGDWYTPAS